MQRRLTRDSSSQGQASTTTTFTQGRQAPAGGEAKALLPSKPSAPARRQYQPHHVVGRLHGHQKPQKRVMQRRLATPAKSPVAAILLRWQAATAWRRWRQWVGSLANTVAQVVPWPPAVPQPVPAVR